MLTVERIAYVHETTAAWRRAGNRIAFVPTMGNLHAGHMALVERAKGVADRVVASIFVNPLQFGPSEDYQTYPRTLPQDSELLTQAGVDLLFAPTVKEMYPRGQAATTRVVVPELSHILCGAFRPALFEGAATVVNRLFNIVQPDVALFGEKDFQQLLVLRRMVEDLCMPVEVMGVPTVREHDGLAMSSRNGYLSPEDRRRAPLLYESLRSVEAAVASGRRDFDQLEREAGERLQAGGFAVDYVAIRRQVDLQPPTSEADQALVVLAAARLGQARLIDNLALPLRSAA